MRWLLLCLLVITGCASQSPLPVVPTSRPILTFRLEGELSILSPQRNFAGRIDWQHRANSDDIALYSPWGGQVARIEKNFNEVTFQDAKGRILRASNASSLTKKVLGLDLPLDELSDWVVGRLTWHPVDQTPNYDAKGQLHSFSQADWHIEYLEYTNQNGLVLPQKILLKSAQVKVRIFIRAWTQLGVEPPVSSQ